METKFLNGVAAYLRIVVGGVILLLLGRALVLHSDPPWWAICLWTLMLAVLVSEIRTVVLKHLKRKVERDDNG